MEIAATIGVARSRGVEPRFNADWPYQPWFSLPDDWFTDDFTGTVDLEKCDELAHLDPAERPFAQDRSLWAHCEAEIRRLLRPSLAARKTLNGYTDFWALPRPVLAVHVRRGDAVQANDLLTPDKWRYHPLRPLSYYQGAIAIQQPGAASIAVFGDDPTWNRAFIPGDYHHEGVPRPKPHEADYQTAPILDWIDWFLLASSGRFVLSNSTFGVMAAWLSGSESVVVPRPFWGPTLAVYSDASRMIPVHWRWLDHPIGPENPIDHPVV
ncbi:MAG: alpha-1,2-fucosyltransferase [Pseudomonadota bacterium]